MALATRLIGLKWYFGTTSLICELDVDWNTSRLVEQDSRFHWVVVTEGFFDYFAVLSVAEAVQLHREETQARPAELATFQTTFQEANYIVAHIYEWDSG
jgi:hypothetical protein